MEFNIGDRVRIKKYQDLHEQIGRGCAKLCGKEGVVIDTLWSGSKGTIYKIHVDGYDRPSSIDFPATAIDLVKDLDKKSYAYEFEILDNVVVAKFYEVGEDHKTEIARGHGHIIHEGEPGIAQAASYALKRIYHKITEGTVCHR